MAEGKQDFVLPTSAVPTGLLCFAFLTQDFILGYFQSSLRDWGAPQVGKHNWTLLAMHYASAAIHK